MILRWRVADDEEAGEGKEKSHLLSTHIDIHS